MRFISELDAVNLIRGAVGKAPVSTLSTTNPDVIAAQLRLKNSATELQTKSWWFNTELSFKLLPNTEGHIVLPNNAVEVRPKDPFSYLTTRGNKLYDPNNNTFVFTGPVTAELMLDLDYEDLPYVAANYIQYDAARKFQGDFDGDPNRIKDLREDTQNAWLLLREAEQRNRRPNVLCSAGSLRIHRRVNPAGFSLNPLYPGG